MVYNEILKELRERNNVKQKELAEILGITRSLYGRYENEHTIIPTKYLNKICNYFEVSFDYIFNFTNKMIYQNEKNDIDKKLSGMRLKEFRKEHKLTQDALSNILKVSRTTITEYERGTNIIATPFLYTICKEYRISADYLLGKIDK